MALMFGDELTDVSEDEQALASFLDLARNREQVGGANDLAFDDDAQDAFEQDPDEELTAPGLEDRVIPDTVFEPRKGRGPSVAAKKDIRAKTAFMLTAAGGVWQARDRHCGGVFVESVPDVSDALAEIFCDSPDIVKWFTASNKYMKWATLAMALQPVAVTIAQHHLFHSIDDSEPQPGVPVDWSKYGAGG